MWPWGLRPHHFWGGGWGWLGIIGMILNLLMWLGLLVGTVLLVIWPVRTSRTAGQIGDRAAGSDLTPREILQRRYARGDITREQYLDMLADLEDDWANR